MKTFNELAEEMGMQRQTLYKRYKDKLYKELEPHIRKIGNVLFIDEEGEKILRENSVKNINTIYDDTVLLSKINELINKIDDMQKEIEYIKNIVDNKLNIDNPINIKSSIKNQNKINNSDENFNNISEYEQIEKLLMEGKSYKYIRTELKIADRKIKKVRDKLSEEGRLPNK